MKLLTPLILGILCQTGWSQNGEAFTPFSSLSKWQPVPEKLEAGRSGDKIVLQTKSADLLKISQTPDSSQATIILRIDSVTGPPGTKGGLSLHDNIETPYVVGATLLVDPEGNIEIAHKTWENYQLTPPEEPMDFPFWVLIGYSGGGFGCHISQDHSIWETALLFPVTFPGGPYDLLLQSGVENEEASVTFSDVTLSGADANDNGITDGWEVQNFGHVLRIEDPDDPDSDGRSNQQEWLDLTDPNVRDQPMVQTLSKTASGFTLQLSKTVYSGLTFERSHDLLTWEIVPHTDFTIDYSFPDDTTTINFISDEEQTLFYRTKHTPRIDPDPFLLFPIIGN